MKQKGKKVNELARERIIALLVLAKNIYPAHPTLAHRYVEIARKIAMKATIRIPAGLQRQYCRFCHHYLYPGANVRIRTRKGKVVIACLDCKKFTRIPLAKQRD